MVGPSLSTIPSVLPHPNNPPSLQSQRSALHSNCYTALRLHLKISFFALNERNEQEKRGKKQKNLRHLLSGESSLFYVSIVKFHSYEFCRNKLLIYNILVLGNCPGFSNSGSCREMGHEARSSLSLLYSITMGSLRSASLRCTFCCFKSFL